MKVGDCVLQLRGYLLKRNKEHCKANLLGAKYKRRWVELTADTLVYAKSQQELLSGGKIEVFSLHKLIWVRRDGDAKFQVKFPERVLVFKVEVGGSTERNKWVAALEQAKNVEEAQQQCGNLEKLEQLKKGAEELLLDANSSNGSLSSIPAHRATLSAAGSSLLVESVNGQAYTGSRARNAGLAPTLAGLANSTTGSRMTETGGRPLSPRSLLASAKTGSAFVSSTSSAAGSDTVYSRTSRGTGVVQPYDEDKDESSTEGDSEGRESIHGPVVRAGSLDLALNSMEAAKPNDRAGSSSSNSSSTAFAGAAAAMQEVDRSAESATRRQERRASLQRRLTPGVMLISPSSLPSPDVASTAQQPEPAAVLRLSVGNSSACSTPRSQGAELPSKQQPPQQRLQQQCSSPTAAMVEDFCNQILRLDSDDIGAYSKSNSAGPPAQSRAAPPPGIRRRTETSSPRPGSAPQYRPGTPLKSCLRGSSANNSSCSSSAGNSQQLLSCSGSYSTPGSSAEAAAAAAAAVASLGLHQSAGGSSSPLSKMLSGARHNNSSMHAAGNITGDEGWIEDDWDDPSDDDGDESTRVGQAEPRQGMKHCVEGRFGPVAKGSKSPRQHVPGSTKAGAASSGMVKGVAADRNWLDEDFDD